MKARVHFNRYNVMYDFTVDYIVVVQIAYKVKSEEITPRSVAQLLPPAGVIDYLLALI